MKPGYDQFFKNAKKASGVKKPSVQPPKTSSKVRPSQTAEDVLREALKIKENRRPSPRPPMMAISIVLVALIVAGYGLLNPIDATSWFNQIEFHLFGVAEAADPASPQQENPAGTKATSAAQVAEADKKSGAEACTEMKGFSEEELSHFNKLNERKNELDLREADLNALEEELHKQKKEIEDRVVKLEQIREDVAGVLKERVEVDQQRVNTLVDFYSNMKPKQAAEIFSKLNEDLTVEILGKMKKKNAADILNLLEPVKARTLSEKFTGYKRI